MVSGFTAHCAGCSRGRTRSHRQLAGLHMNQGRSKPSSLPARDQAPLQTTLRVVQEQSRIRHKLIEFAPEPQRFACASTVTEPFQDMNNCYRWEVAHGETAYSVA